MEFSLSLHRPSEAGLGSLSWIEHFLSPQPISPAVVLGLLWYLIKEQTDRDAPKDRTRIEDTITRLQQWLLAELLSPDLFQTAGYEVLQGGAEGLREFLYLLAVRRWPEYRTLIVHQHWQSLFADYCQALGSVPPAAKTGVTSMQQTKAEVAALFGQARHAGFESRARQYGDLLRLEYWQGDAASIRLVPHPLELHIADTARADGSIHVADAHRQARTLGFSVAESMLILDLAVKRGLLDRRDEHLTAPSAPSSAELLARLRELESRCSKLQGAPPAIQAELATLRRDAEAGMETARTGWRLDQMEQILSQAEADSRTAEAARYDQIRSRALDLLPSLGPLPLPVETSDLAAHLGAVHGRLDTDRQQLRTRVETLLASNTGPLPKDVESFLERVVAWRRDAQLLARWQKVAERLAALHDALTWLDTNSDVLGEMQVESEKIIRSARAVLAAAGISRLAEVARLEIDLAGVEDRFRQASEARDAAYRCAVESLSGHAANLMNLPISLPSLAYDPHDHNGSVRRLSEAVATIISKAVTMLVLEVAETGGSKEDKLRRAKLMADIRALARRAADPEWLVLKSAPRLRDEATRAILAIRGRVSSRSFGPAASDVAGVIRTGIIQMLVSPEIDRFSFRDIVQQLAKRATRPAILSELIALEQSGVLDIIVELHDGRREAK